jgi:uncharacterized protein with PIN domain
MVTIIIVTACAIIGMVSAYFLGQNNPVEQACEEIIKDETGASVNLCPTCKQPIPAASTGNKAAS